MDSPDRMIVVIGGREYFIDRDTLRPSQSSFEREVLTRLEGIESRVGALETEVGYLRHDQEHLQTSVYWVLGTISVFLASLIIPSLRKKDGLGIQDVIALMSWRDNHKNGDEDNGPRTAG